MARKAVAATLATVILFTALVVANATVMTAQDNSLAAAQMVNLLGREQLYASTLAGSTSLIAEAQLQAFVASNGASCTDLPSYLHSVSWADTITGSDSKGVFYNSTSKVLADFDPGSLGDNMTLVAPFAGHVSGLLNLDAIVKTRIVGGGGTAQIYRDETHALNLPIKVSAAESLCVASINAFSAAFSTTRCNSTTQAAMFAKALPYLESWASSVGFAFYAGWTGGCTVTYWITMFQNGIQGPSGTFGWRVSGGGSILTGTPVPTNSTTPTPPPLPPSDGSGSYLGKL